MPVQIACPNTECDASYSVADANLGRVGRCKKCGAEFSLIPGTRAGTEMSSFQVDFDSTRDSGGAALPDSFGRYKVVRLLGRGGMGSVYLAHDGQLDRDVALKVPHIVAFADRPDVRERFFREAQAAARFHHANFCPIHDIGEVDGVPYLTMAFVEGETLACSIDHDKGWPTRRAAEVARELAMALAELHREGIVHRDLKPANVMVDARGRMILMDFGLARWFDDIDSSFTPTGAILGTPAYMPPEQAAGDLKAVGPRSDLYSLGVILYELLTGRRPFEGPITAVLGMIAFVEPTRPSTLRPGLDPRLEAVCLKAMAKKPDDRYASMDEFAGALQAWLDEDHHGPTLESVSLPTLSSDSEVGSKLPLSKKIRDGRPSIRTWIAAAAAFAALLFGIIIYVATDKGRIKIEVNDPNAVVHVDGQQVRIEGLGDPITLKAGEHELSVKQGDVEVETRKFVVRRGDNPALILELEPPPTKESPSADPMPSAVAMVDPSPSKPAETSKNKSSPAELPSKPAEKMTSPPTQPLRVDEFDSPRGGLPRDINIPHNPNHGRSDGVYFVYFPKGSNYWNIFDVRSEVAIEVVARVLSEEPGKGDAWSVQAHNRTAARGFLIKINGKRQLSLEPSSWQSARDFQQVGPKMGPIMHPAINPGSEFNKLLLIMRKREVVIFVNGVQVCDPLKFDFDIIPSVLQFGCVGPGKKRAEFDRLEIREVTATGEYEPVQPKNAPSADPNPPGVVKVDLGTPPSKPADILKPREPSTKGDAGLITNSLGMKLKLIPAGEFEMGSDDSDLIAGNDEKVDGKKHPVRITKPFYLGTTEVTVGQFRQFVVKASYKTEGERDGRGGAQGWDEAKGKFEQSSKYSWSSPGFEQEDDHPVVNVSWNDAVAFCEWLSGQEGKRYRLPTEAEWEYSCRAGTKTQFWSGDDLESLATAGNVMDGTATEKHAGRIYAIKAKDGFAFTSPVGHFAPNPFGLFDMHGNVREWCADWYDPLYYSKSPVADPQNFSQAQHRVMRGGDWYMDPRDCRSARRGSNSPFVRTSNRGFRVARGK